MEKQIRYRGSRGECGSVCQGTDSSSSSSAGQIQPRCLGVWSKSEGSLRRKSSVPDSCYSGMPEVLRGDINSWQPGRKQGAKIPQPQWRFIPTHQREQVPREDRGDRVRRCCPVRPLLRQEVPHHLCHPVRVPAGGGVRRELQEELFHRV